METPVAQELPQKTRKPPRQLTQAEKQAIVAACAIPGAVKGQVAKDFNVRAEVVSRILKQVKAVQNPANPLSDDFRPGLISRAVKAVTRGMDCEKNVYLAAGIGVDTLKGLGVFTTGPQVHVGDNNIQVSWGAPLKLDESGECIDVKACSETDTPVSD